MDRNIKTLVSKWKISLKQFTVVFIQDNNNEHLKQISCISFLFKIFHASTSRLYLVSSTKKSNSLSRIVHEIYSQMWYQNSSQRKSCREGELSRRSSPELENCSYCGIGVKINIYSDKDMRWEELVYPLSQDSIHQAEINGELKLHWSMKADVCCTSHLNINTSRDNRCLSIQYVKTNCWVIKKSDMSKI